MGSLPAFAVRNDDMFASSGYDNADAEVGTAPLAREAVSECGVVGAPARDRGNVVEAHVVLIAGCTGDESLTKAFQDLIKAMIAPYKYSRSIRFRDDLPKTPAGKVQLLKLRDMQVQKKRRLR